MSLASTPTYQLTKSNQPAPHPLVINSHTQSRPSILQVAYPIDQSDPLMSYYKYQSKDQIWRDLNSSCKIMTINTQPVLQTQNSNLKNLSKQLIKNERYCQRKGYLPKIQLSKQTETKNAKSDPNIDCCQIIDLNNKNGTHIKNIQKKQSKAISKNKTPNQARISHLWAKRKQSSLTKCSLTIFKSDQQNGSECTTIRSDPKEILLRMFEQQSQKKKSPERHVAVIHEQSQTQESISASCTHRVMIGTPSEQGSQDRTIQLSCFEDESIGSVREFQLQDSSRSTSFNDQ